MSEYPTKEKDQEPKGKKALQAWVDSDDESDDLLSEFCFMAIEEEKKKYFKRAFEELYVESLCMAKKNKELIENN